MIYLETHGFTTDSEDSAVEICEQIKTGYHYIAIIKIATEYQIWLTNNYPGAFLKDLLLEIIDGEMYFNNYKKEDK